MPKVVMILVLIMSFYPVWGQTTSRVLQASAFPGTTADQEIRECLAALPTGGICDARGFGATLQALSSTIVVGVGDESTPVTLLLDPATRFAPPNQSATLFSIQAGGSIDGATCDVTSIPGWNAACVSTLGSIGVNNYSSSHLAKITCTGTLNGGGHCVEFSPNKGGTSGGESRVMFIHVKDVKVYGMEAGVYLSAMQTSGYVWVNGNWFDDVLCVLSQNCIDIQVSGTGTTTQVSENSFSELKVEASENNLTAVKMKVAGDSTSEFNSFNDMIAFDFPAQSVVLNLSSRTQKNQFSGFFCFAVCGNTTYVDQGNGNVIIDWWNQQEVNTSIAILTPDATRQGVLESGANGPQLAVDSGNDFRIYGGNGGLKVLPGTGGDHNLYLQSLDATPQMIVFNAPLFTPGIVLNGGVNLGGSSTYLPVYGPDSVRQGYIKFGINGPEIDLDNLRDLRVYGANGGFKVQPGNGADHNLYLQSLDPGNGAIVLNKPLAAAGGAANRVVCWKSDGVTMGYCSTQPNATGGCTCR